MLLRVVPQLFSLQPSDVLHRSGESNHVVPQRRSPGSEQREQRDRDARVAKADIEWDAEAGQAHTVAGYQDRNDQSRDVRGGHHGEPPAAIGFVGQLVSDGLALDRERSREDRLQHDDQPLGREADGENQCGQVA